MRNRLISCVLAPAACALLAGALFAEKYKNPEWKKLTSDLQAAIGGAEPATVVELVRKVAEDESRRAVEFLVQLGLQVTNPEVYLEIKRAIASMSDKTAVKEILARIEKDKDIRVRIMLVEVLGLKGDEEYADEVGALLAGRERQDPVLVRTAIEALAGIGGKKSMKFLIDYLEKVEKERKGSSIMGTDWEGCRAALKHITGGEADYEKASDWRNYCETLPRDWKPAPPPAGEGAASEDWKKGKVVTTVRMPPQVPRFFGVEVVSRTPVFVIDVSGSMTEKDPLPPQPPPKPEPAPEPGKDPGTTLTDPVKKAQPPAPKPPDPSQPQVLDDERMRIRRAQKELIKLINALNPTVMFNIIAYEMHVHVWSEGGLKSATPENKDSAIKFVEGFTATATTHTDEALQKAWENIKDGCDTIYLLSDGSPTHKGDNSDTDMLVDNILNFFRENNKFHKVKVFTLGFKSANVPFMTRLARENGGTFTDIK